MDKKEAGLITEETIQMWRAKYRKISEVIIEDGDDKFVCYFRRPDMDTMSAVTKLSKTDEVKAANILFDNCWLGGDQMIKEDAVLKMSAISQLNKIMTVQTVTLKNL